MKDSDDKSTIPKVIHPSISPRSASSTLNIIKVGIDKLYVYVTKLWMVYLFRGVGYNCDFVAEAMAEVTFKNLVTFVFSTKFFRKRNKSLLLNRWTQAQMFAAWSILLTSFPGGWRQRIATTHRELKMRRSCGLEKQTRVAWKQWSSLRIALPELLAVASGQTIGRTSAALFSSSAASLTQKLLPPNHACPGTTQRRS